MTNKANDKRFARVVSFVKQIKLEGWFIVIFLLFGVVFAVMTPPGWYTDETNHTYRIDQLSRGNLFSEEVVDPQSGYKAFGGNVSSGLVDLYDATGPRAPGAVGDPDRKVSTSIFAPSSEMYTHKDTGETTPINFSGGAVYSPISYLLYIPVFFIGNLLSLPFFWIIVVCRLLGLIATGLAFYWAIKIIPVGKWIIFAFGLLPAVVVQSVSVGADAPQMAVAVLFLALLSKYIYTKAEPGMAVYGAFMAIGVALALIKLAYAPLVLLLLALPLVHERYRKKKHIIYIFSIIAISLFAGYIWTQLVAYIDINSNPQANFEAQKAFILGSPQTFAVTLYYTFFTNAQSSMANIFGSFIWDSAPLPAIYAYLASAALLCSLFVKSSREAVVTLTSKSLRLWKTALLVVCGICVVLIATALYVYSTTLRQTSIVGIQSRYFLPLLPFVMLVLYGNTVKNQRVVKRGIVILLCIVLLGSIATIYERLYHALPLLG